MPANATRPSPPIPKPSWPTLPTSMHWRARGRDYQAAGDRQKAQADFDKAIETQPGSRRKLPGARRVLYGHRPSRTRHPRLHPGHQPRSWNEPTSIPRAAMPTSKSGSSPRPRKTSPRPSSCASITRNPISDAASLAPNSAVSRCPGRFRFLHRPQAGSRTVPRGAGAGLHRINDFTHALTDLNDALNLNPRGSARLARARRRAGASQ